MSVSVTSPSCRMNAMWVTFLSRPSAWHRSLRVRLISPMAPAHTPSITKSAASSAVSFFVIACFLISYFFLKMNSLENT